MSAIRPPRSQMNPTEGFEEFVAIVEEGSVSGAARRLDMPRATVSRHLARLERRLGVRLAHRSSRTLQLTQAGRLLFDRARRILNEAREAHDDVGRLDDVPRGLLRVSVPTGPQSWFTALASGFLDAYPEVSLDVVSTGRLVDLVAEDVDVVIRASAQPDPNLIGRVLATSRLTCVASPDYLRRYGEPRSVDDLADHECIRNLGGDGRSRWPLIDGSRVQVSGRFASNDLITRWHAAIVGRGIALVPESFIVGAERRGLLVRVLEDVIGEDARIWVLYAEREFRPPKIRAFVDFLFEWSKTHGFFDDTIAEQLSSLAG